MKDLLFICVQYLTPQHCLSRAAGWLANNPTPWVKNTFINWFIRRYRVDMSEAAQPDPAYYETFNAFFTRALKDGARPLDANARAVACPADGTVSQIGDIDSGFIFQAKGQNYSASSLLGGDEPLAKEFYQGKFATIYLSPKDYHRVHMPYAGSLRKTLYVPGDLFSVNPVTAENVPNLFARNERLVCIFDTELGPMAVVLVGAMIVAAIETVWAGQVVPIPRTAHTTDYTAPSQLVQLEKGEELGHFKLGSTVILLYGKDAVSWVEDISAGAGVRMGQTLAIRGA